MSEFDGLEPECPDPDALIRALGGGQPSMGVRLTWQQACQARALLRLRKANSLPDRAVLLREVARLAGGFVRLPVGWVGDLQECTYELLPHRIEVREESNGRVLVRLTADHEPEDALSPLWAEVDSVVEIDTQLRRVLESQPGDGVLARTSPFRRYRSSAQREAFRSFVTLPPGGTLLATLATSTGKSLLFQAGIRWLQELAPPDERAMALVVVPTVALALDHEESVQAEYPGLSACSLIGSLESEKRQELLAGARRGEFDLLFMAPEMLFGKDRSAILDMALERNQRPSHARGRLAAIYVDEAHIIESWGRSFRPDFQRLPGVIGELRARNPGLRTALLSATVNREALRLFRQAYTSDGELSVVSEGMPRREFDLVMHRFSSPRERYGAITRLIDIAPRPAILYTTRVKDSNDLGAALRDCGYHRIAVFNGDTPPDERLAIVRGWRNDDIDLVVATSALGMGVNKGDVRTIIHACMPESASRFYQEIGRAGRDGHQAFSFLFMAPGDGDDAVRMALGSNLTLETASKRWAVLLQRGARHSTEDGVVFYDFDLTAAPPGNPHPGMRNIRWNQSLLVQMQRYGALQAHSIDEDRAKWRVAVNERGAALFDAETMDDALSALFAARDAEQAAYRHQLGLFRRAMPGSRGSYCSLSIIYGLVDDLASTPWPCGRCPWCRNKGHHPHPLLESPYIERTAILHERSTSRSGSLAIDPLQPPSLDLVRGLLQLGVQQFIVPDDYADVVVESLVDQSGQRVPGFVLTWGQVAKLDPLALPPLPTALWVCPFSSPRQRAEAITKLKALHDARNHAFTVRVWLGDPRVKFDDDGRTRKVFDIFAPTPVRALAHLRYLLEEGKTE